MEECYGLNVIIKATRHPIYLENLKLFDISSEELKDLGNMFLSIANKYGDKYGEE